MMTRLFLPALPAAAAALFLCSCGKPETAKVLIKDEKVGAGAAGSMNMGSRLKNEQSAFLRRHAADPMEWYPWGAEAFEKAKKENKPLLVVVGYASCPWSQRMTTESYTSTGPAQFANRNFVCVLVDREERPDINTALLHYVHWKSRGKQSGWPLHVWLTPDGHPMEKGVYFPPNSVGANPSWSLMLQNTANRWANDAVYEAEVAKKDADSFKRSYRQRWQGPPMEGEPSLPVVKEFMAYSADEQLQQFTRANDDMLQEAVLHLPAAKLEELWKRLTPEQSTSIIQRLRAPAASAFYAKFSGSARAAALERFLTAIRADSFAKLSAIFDISNGGFGPAPRFTQQHALENLMRYALRQKGDRFGNDREAMKMVQMTIGGMLRGGIFDQLAGGFHRYSTDVYWMVPQFEKMIYDQGFMAAALTAAAQVTGHQPWLDAAVRTLRYADAELSHPQGGFYCAEGSSSAVAGGKMEEGVFYVWQKAELEAAAGDRGPLLSTVFGLEERGNLPYDSQMRERLGATNILTLKRPPTEAERAAYDEGCARVLEVRRKRPRPMLEDKVLTSWTSAGIIGFARTGFALGDEKLIQRASRAADFILAKLRTKDGALLHAFLDGPSPLPGYSEDYAVFISALIDLYHATGELRWLTDAVDLQERQIAALWDKEDGGFFDGPDSPHLFFRMKSMDETSEMAAGSTSLINLALLSSALNNQDYRDKARRILERFGPQAAATPGGFYRLQHAADIVGDAPQQIILTGAPDAPGRAELLAALRKMWHPTQPLLYMDGGEGEKFLLSKVPDLSSMTAQPGKPAAVHFCTSFKATRTFTAATELAAAISAAHTIPLE